MSKRLDFDYRVFDNCLEIIPHEPITDHAIYEIRINGLKSKTDENKTLTKNSVFIDLTNSEFKVFALLVKNRNRVVSKKEIAVELYNDENKENNRTITMLIKSIRKKIDDKDQTIINSRYGIGYIINE